MKISPEDREQAAELIKRMSLPQCDPDCKLCSGEGMVYMLDMDLEPLGKRPCPRSKPPKLP